MERGTKVRSSFPFFLESASELWFDGCGGTRSCLLLPISSSKGGSPLAGILVAGVNPLHKLDHKYSIFFNLVACQIGALLANAQAKEEHMMVQVITSSALLLLLVTLLSHTLLFSLP